MVRVRNAPNPESLLRLRVQSSGQASADYCVSQTLFHVCRLAMACNGDKLQPDLPSSFGKDSPSRWGVLPGLGGVIRLLSDVLVLDKAIPHYPS